MLIDGLNFRDDIPGRIGDKIRAGKLYEAEMLHYMQGLFIDGDCVDVGCFIGTHSVFFAKKLGKRVYSFDKFMHEEFHDHIKMNNINDYVKFPYYLLPPLDLADLVFSKIGLIKIDVDGSDEIDVLESCKKIIKRDKPHIFIEARTDEKLQQIKKFLKGYKKIQRFNVTPTYYFRYEKS